MNIRMLSRGALATGLAFLALTAGFREAVPHLQPGDVPRTAPQAALAPDVLYGRVTTQGGDRYEGRLRWGGSEEAFWDHAFNGYKDVNPWAAHVPLEHLTEVRPPMRLFGFELPRGERPIDLGRPFMVRFGDIARIDAVGDGAWAFLERGIAFAPAVRVTLKSGTVVNLDRLEAGDFDDGVRIWDQARGVVDVGARQIRSIEFMPAPRTDSAVQRLHGTVQTDRGRFTGFLQWDREQALGTDLLVGATPAGERQLPFNAIRSISRQAPEGARVTLADGQQVVLTGPRAGGPGHRGLYVDDPRYGRVLVSWAAFRRVDFTPGGTGPAYQVFQPGRTLAGRVTTRNGRHLKGLLVYDLDERETTETLDAPWQGVDYSIPFGQIASVVVPSHGGPAQVVLARGDVLPLERAGDLGAGHAGVLVYATGSLQPEYVPWEEVAQIDFDPVRRPADER